MRTGYDSVAGTASEWRRIVPTATPDVIGCYKNGRYANEAAAREAFPHATIVTYDVNGSRPDADILDVEKFDAVPAQCPGWFRHYSGHLPHPAFYTSASSIASVVTAMLDAGYKRDWFLVHSAHYTFTAHICGPHTCGYPQADGTQYADKGKSGQNTDLNVFGDHFFGVVASPKPDMHYALFANESFLIFGNRYGELATVKEYDRLRATQTPKLHPNRARLAMLRARLSLLAGRVLRVGQDAGGGDVWVDSRHLGWRYQQLRHRADGQRFI